MDYVACQAPLSMGFSRQEYWSGLPFPSPGDLPDLGITLLSCVSCTADGFFSTEPQLEKNLPAMHEIQVRSLGREDPLEKGMPIYFSILAWRIP